MATITQGSTLDPAAAGNQESLRELHRRRVGCADRPASTTTTRRRRPARRSRRSRTPAPADIELALDAAHAAKDGWGEASTTERARVLHAHRRRDRGEPRDAGDRRELRQRQADPRDARRRHPARGRPLPLLRVGASAARRARSREIDKDTVAYHFREPLGVVGQIIPFNFPLLMAAWKMAPAIAAGNCTVIKPASPTPWSILKFCELLEDIVPPGVINVVNGPGAEIGRALATSKRIAKIAFTGETATGRLIMQYAAQNLIPSTTELGGKSPNIFFADVMAAGRRVPRQGRRGPRALRVQQGRGLHGTVARADPRIDLRRVHGALPGADRRDPPGPPAGPGDDARPAGLDLADARRSSATADRPRRRRRAADRRPRAQRSAATWRAATTSSRPSSRATTRCGSSRRRSSAPCSR